MFRPRSASIFTIILFHSYLIFFFICIPFVKFIKYSVREEKRFTFVEILNKYLKCYHALLNII